MSFGKEQMVLKILDDKKTEQGCIYLILWNNYSQEWLNEDNISSHSIEVYNEMKIYNETISAPMINPKESLVYCRTTLGNQVLLEQKMECVKYCETNDLPIGYLVTDDVSGRHMKNLDYELGAFIPFLKEYNCIVVSNVEVLGRDIIKVMDFLFTMMKRNIDVHFIKENIIWNNDTTPENRFQVRDILNKVNLISDQKSKSYREETIKLKRLGHQLGTAPFGMKAKKINGIRKFVQNKSEQKIISEIISLYKENINKFENKKINTCQFILQKMKEKCSFFMKKNNIPYSPSFILKIVNKNLKIQEFAINNVMLSLKI